MAEAIKCRNCGVDIPATAPFGHCPKCLLQLGFVASASEVGDVPGSSAGPERSFGDYELLEEIGRGGMGVVYKARQKSSNRIVALKMIRAAAFATEEMKGRFDIEAKAAANLQHPNIVPVYDVGEHGGLDFYSMKLIEGDGLDTQITKGAFRMPSHDQTVGIRTTQMAIVRIIAAIARAVHYAHERGVLHRDLKPSNILIDNQGQPYLTDFGIAKLAGLDGIRVTPSGQILGSLSWMAPEQAAGDTKHATTAADVYGLGAILYEMLTGLPPFRGANVEETFQQVITQPPKHPTAFNRRIDRDLATICLKCLEKAPNGRYRSAEALADDLERWLRREPIQARPVGPVGKFYRWCRRNPKTAGLATAVTFLLVLLAVGSTITAILHATQRGEIRQSVTQGLVKVFEDPRTVTYDIPSPIRRSLTTGLWSAIRRALTGRASPSAPSFELTFGLYAYEHPTNMVQTFSPILAELEDRLTERLGRSVAIHLRMFRNYETAHQAMESGELAFGRMGPSPYLYLLDKGTPVELMAMQDHKSPLTLAIFTRTNSEIARLAGSQAEISVRELLSDRSFAFGDATSTTGNYISKWFLARQGIYGTNLANYAHHSGQIRVIQAVQEGGFDAGAANRDVVARYPDLRIIATQSVADVGLCWVASKTLDPAVRQQMQACLLDLRDRQILGKLESTVTGFKMLPEEKLGPLREIMRGAAAFDAGKK